MHYKCQIRVVLVANEDEVGVTKGSRLEACAMEVGNRFILRDAILPLNATWYSPQDDL